MTRPTRKQPTPPPDDQAKPSPPAAPPPKQHADTPPLTADECKILARRLENEHGKVVKFDLFSALRIAQVLRWVAKRVD